MTTHATLKSDIAEYMARDDLSAVIPTFVRLGEARIRDAVRCREMETSTDLNITTQTTALPTGFLAARRIIIDSTQYRQLSYVTPEEGWRDYRLVTSGNPLFYTIEGSNLVVFPPPADTVTGKLLYFKAFDALSGEDDTNWLLTNHYDVYLYACLTEAKAYIEDDDQAAKYLTQFEKACDRVNATANQGRQGNVMRRRSYVP